MSDYREIPLSRGLVALVDAADYEHVVSVGKWYANPSDRTFYARKNFWRGGSCYSVRMHTHITGWPYVDHRDGNGLNNRRQNLRPADGSNNTWNRQRRSDNSSGYKGVHLYRDRVRWVAAIGAHGRNRHIGIFSTREDAARAYDLAALKLFGEFARTNFPRGDYA